MENRPGGGIIGAQSVIKAAADGYTLLLCDDGVITAAPILYKRADYDPAPQLSPISLTPA